MNVNSVNSVSSVSKIQSPNNVRKVVDTGLKKDTFERTSFKGDFNVDNAVKELKDLKNFKGTPKFTDDKIETIKGELVKSPDKWEPFKELVQKNTR